MTIARRDNLSHCCRIDLTKCPNCGRDVREAERKFLDWIRENPQLDSISAALSVQNCDVWVHQYKSHADRRGDRRINNLMLVEYKAFGADMSFAQRDTLWIVNQILRPEIGRAKTFKVRGLDPQGKLRPRTVHCFGVHKLQIIDGDVPGEGGQIIWDRKAIDVEQLERVLRFDLHPDTLRPRSDRRHHTINEPLLEGVGSVATSPTTARKGSSFRVGRSARRTE